MTKSRAWKKAFLLVFGTALALPDFELSANFNLLFMNKDPERIGRVVMREQNTDIFRAFADIAAATGGMVDTSQNPAAAFKNALRAADEYYLLYFTPTAEAAGAAFHPLSIRVKDRKYKVVHRMGYIGS